jgi:hypothetical protein
MDRGRWVKKSVGGKTAAKRKKPAPGWMAEIDAQARAAIRSACLDVAKQFGFPADKVVFSTETYQFNLNGKRFTASGTCDLYGERRITMYPDRCTVDSAPGIMAHEVGHAKHHRVREQLMQEREDLVRERRVKVGAKLMHPLKTDGTIRAGHGLEEKYPVYSELERFENLIDQLHKDDGVSGYSREYWASDEGAFKAMDETVAEIMRIQFESKRDTGKDWGSQEARQVKPLWRDYFEAIMRASKKISQ